MCQWSFIGPPTLPLLSGCLRPSLPPSSLPAFTYNYFFFFSLTHSLAHRLTRPPTHSPTDSLTHSPVRCARSTAEDFPALLESLEAVQSRPNPTSPQSQSQSHSPHSSSEPPSNPMPDNDDDNDTMMRPNQEGDLREEWCAQMRAVLVLRQCTRALRARVDTIGASMMTEEELTA
eukprot:GHVU01143191.1.p1 GENE.GHVU01143191.1~~GHVU01143191.1.p1  ORF type:complete len:175 (-),score=17.52 GHVU01143191.1:69-593(-)